MYFSETMQSNHTETEKLREFNYCFNKYFSQLLQKFPMIIIMIIF